MAKHPNQYTKGADDKSGKSKSKSKSSSSSSSSGSSMSSTTKDALHKFKMETAREVGVNLKQGYNGNLTSKEAGSIGGQMVKKLIEKAEKNL